MGLYDLFRVNGYPTYYPPRKTPVTADVLEVGLIFAIVIIAFSLIIIIPGVRGRERIFYTIRVLVGIFVLGAILLVNFGQEWEVAEIHDVPTLYRAGLKEEIHADITVKIGLRSWNITLQAGHDNDYVVSFDNGLTNETINYNERFHWDSLGFAQGRGGFGPFAGLYNREYRAAQLKGLPYPILWIAEYFTIDGEFIRWGRFYRQAGFYAHIVVWLAFPLWILALILFKMVLRYGGYFSIMTGLSLVCANIIYALVRNPLELVIPFTDEKKLEFHWGWCFILCAVLGCLTIAIGIAVVVLDNTKAESLAKFFDFDITQELEEFYADPAQLQEILSRDRKSRFGFTQRFKKTQKYTPSDHTSNGATASTVEMDDMGGYKNPAVNNERRQFRKRTMMKSVMADKKKKERPQPPARRIQHSPSEDEDQQDYVNVAAEIGAKAAAGQSNVSFAPDD